MKQFQQHLQQLIREGAATRRALVRHVAGMPVEHLATLQPDTVRLLGASGMVAVLEKHAAQRLQGPLPPVERRSPKAPKNPLPGLIVLIGVLTGLGLVPEHLAPVRLSTPGSSRSIETTTWPACPRLDHAVDGCLYRVGGGGDLSLVEGANRLGLMAEDFIALNTHIAARPSDPLPRGSQLVVWRDKLILKGTSK